MSHLSSMWVPWGDLTSCSSIWGRLADTFAREPPVWLPPPGDPTTADQTAVRVLELVVLEPDEPDWGGNDDEDIIPAIIIPVPKNCASPSCPPTWAAGSCRRGPLGRVDRKAAIRATAHGADNQ